MKDLEVKLDIHGELSVSDSTKAAGLGDRSTQALILCLEKLAEVKVHSPE